MVQFRRKPVQHVPPPPNLDENTEVWGIPETGEVFTSYESYLRRRDFYQQKKFTCDITGHSGLTYFEALHSEMVESTEVDNTFPEPLREPVLRKVQHSTIPRMDDVVNFVFNEFKDDFFPKEHVAVFMADGAKLEGVVREKMTFPRMRQSDGSVTESYSRYFVSIKTMPGQEAMADSKHLTRDRNTFTKAKLKSFLKHSIVKEGAQGASYWQVKEQLARHYNIPTQLPPDLLQKDKPVEKKGPPSRHKVDQEGSFFNFLADLANQNQARPLAAKKPSKSTNPFDPIHAEESLIRAKYPAFATNHAPANGFVPQHPGQGFFDIMNRIPGQQSKLTDMWRRDQPPQGQPVDHLRHANVDMGRKWIPTNQVPQAPPRPPPPVYPIEDTELPPKRGPPSKEVVRTRPPLKFFSDDGPTGGDESERNNGLKMSSVGSLLSVWNLLNVHDNIYYLDSFTFDDFVDAMRWSSNTVECELLNETHCSVLKQLVNEKGELQIRLPALNDEDDEDDEAEGEVESEPESEPELRPPARSTRSSLAKAEAAALKAKSPTPEPPKDLHRAQELFSEVDWVERLKVGDFAAGGWQLILAGLIWRVSFFEAKKEICDKILAHLVPMDEEPDQETVRLRYAELDINLRIAALEIAAMLSVTTKTFRDHLERSTTDMTDIRKERMEFQRARKPLVEELRQLDEQRKILLPENMPSTPPPESTESPDISMSGIETEEPKDPDGEEGSDEDVPRNSRSLRRSTNDQASSRKRKREEEAIRKEREKKEKAEAAKNKQAAEWKKLLKAIEKKKEEIRQCEKSIADCENDLREANVQRTKLLGVDRFCNRYFWFERNGMPYRGLPNSSTAHYGYANGRLWVQGPDESDLEGLLKLPAEDLKRHRQLFAMTPAERKEQCEGPTQLTNANQWGYYDDPGDIEQLLFYLDDRGNRERLLIKELEAFREPIVEHMKKLKEHLTETEERKTAGEEQATRVSTRTKTYVDVDATKHRCLAWKNTIALSKFGHLHSDQPRPKKQKKAAEPKVKVPLNRSGKPLTRQGQRYSNL